jgi:taurine dioxygenase
MTAGTQSSGTVVAGWPLPVFERIEIEPLTGAAGCEIRGVDLTRPLEPEVLAEVMRAFEHFLVILFRDQPLDVPALKRFSQYFGELTELPQAPIYANDPLIQEVRREAHEPVSVVPFTRFHTDSPFLPEPPRCMVMQALDVPHFGGDTAFANMFLAYEDLSAGLKELAGRLRVVYSGKDIWSRNAKLPPEQRLRLRDEHGFIDEQLAATHPAVRTQAGTGRKALYVTQAYFQNFAGWSIDDSRPLLEYLAGLPYRIQYQCRIRWRRNSVIVWDNRYLQHCGIHDYRNERRHLIRTTILGETPH